MLAFKAWNVPYFYKYKIRGNSPGQAMYGECPDWAQVIAESAEDAKRLLIEAAKTGVFDWADHTFSRYRDSNEVKHSYSLVLSDLTIRMIQDHVLGSHIEQKVIKVDFELPLDRES